MSKYAYVELESGMIIETEGPELWPEGKRLSVKEGQRRLRAEYMKDLRKLLRPGKQVFTKVTHVSRSGMSRSIECYVISRNEFINISGRVARVIGERLDEKNGGIRVTGCGMDMGFHVVCLLGRYMWPKGTKKPLNEDGGYALKQRWI